MSDYAAARHNMVECQLRTNKVTDLAIIAAMLEVPRERFVPAKQCNIAYIDDDLSLGNGRCLMEPRVFARLLQLAEIKSSDVVLDVGCATGYSAAVLSRLASTVVGVENHVELAQQATQILVELNIDNVVVTGDDLASGCAAHAPFDVIVIEGAVEELPGAILDQVAEGGRLVAVVRGRDGVGCGTLVSRRDGVLCRRAAFDAATPLLPGFTREPGFVF